jgi:hypothetical protein
MKPVKTTTRACSDQRRFTAGFIPGNHSDREVITGTSKPARSHQFPKTQAGLSEAELSSGTILPPPRSETGLREIYKTLLVQHLRLLHESGTQVASNAMSGK